MKDESVGRPARCFVAVSLPGSVRKWFKRYQADVRKSGVRASWPKPDPLHITLKFLGQVPAEHISQIQDCMSRAVELVRPGDIKLTCSGFGVFPSVKNARVLWAGIRGNTDILEQLAREIEHQIYLGLGMKKEKRRFSPHLSLARAKEKIPPQKVIEWMTAFEKTESSSFHVSRIDLFKSVLHASGARHERIFSVNF